MTKDEFNRRLLPLDDTKTVQLTALAADIRRQLDEPVRSAISLALGENRKTASTAKCLLSDLDELAVMALLATPDEKTKPFEKGWLCQTVVSADLQLRAAIARHLDKMLGDKTPVPVIPADIPAEEAPPQTRVCDEAYLQMRRLLNLPESAEENAVAERTFLNYPNNRRDAEIQRARQSKTWTNLQE